jgi:hypothetical protein
MLDLMKAALRRHSVDAPFYLQGLLNQRDQNPITSTMVMSPFETTNVREAFLATEPAACTSKGGKEIKLFMC